MAQNLELCSLPAEAKLEYLAEGGANVVYRLRFSEETPRSSTPPIEADLHFVPEAESVSTPPPSDISPSASPPLCASSNSSVYAHARFRGRLLRLRKDVPGAMTCTEQMDSWQRNIEPLFERSQLVGQELIAVRNSSMRQLNDMLLAAEKDGTRPTKRHGVYLCTEEAYGVLMDDMSSTGYNSTALALEFKPKWLAQSPNAPTDSTRCRTCALRVMRKFTQSLQKPSKKESNSWAICPLDLGTRDTSTTTTCPATILLDDRTVSVCVRLKLEAYLEATPILARLRELQRQLDPCGILSSTGEPANDLLVAMALRDCTLYVRIASDDSVAIEGRLGDLDLKRGSAKREYWRSTEQDLIAGGWYQGRGEVSRAWTTCRLERHE